MNKKGKGETGKKIAIYLTDNREMAPLYRDLKICKKRIRKQENWQGT